MSERVEHSDAYWTGWGRCVLWHAFRLATYPEHSGDVFDYLDGGHDGRRVWQEEERHAWGGSQDAVTRRVAELAVVLEKRAERVVYGYTADETHGYRQGLNDAAAIITHRDPESAA